MKLSLEEQEELEMFLDSAAYSVVLKVLRMGLEKHKEALLNAPASEESDGLRLMLLKSRYAGAEDQVALISKLKRTKKL